MRIQRLAVRKELLLPDPVWSAVQVTSLLLTEQVSRLPRPHPVVPLWAPSRAGAACPAPRTSSAAAVSQGRRGNPRASGQDFCRDSTLNLRN